MPNLAIIPARGGSKRIPRKNIKLFYDQPIIGYSIKAAMECGLFDEIMVSTDDDEIAEIAKNYGASVPFLRSSKNSDDYATTYAVIEEVVNIYKSKLKYFESVCCIYPCAPLITSKSILKSKKQLDEYSRSTVIPVVKFGYPISRALISDDDKIKMMFSENEFQRTQDLDEVYHDAGQFYWADTEKLLKAKSLFTDNTGYIVLSPTEVQDIDTEEDWKMAELKYKLFYHD